MHHFDNDGTVKTKFIALKNLTNATAKEILAALKIISEYGINNISKNLVGFCSDGVSVNLEVHQDLVVLIKEQYTWLISIID